jgi:hypothetical protein
MSNSLTISALATAANEETASVAAIPAAMIFLIFMIKNPPKNFSNAFLPLPVNYYTKYSLFFQ